MSMTSPTTEQTIPLRTGIYLYCIVDRSMIPQTLWKISGLCGQPLKIIHYRDISAVVSDVQGDRQRATRDNLLTHTLVLEKILEHQQLLPIRFGIMASCEEDIVNNILKEHYWNFHEILQGLKGKKELGVKVLWNQAAIIQEILGQDEQICHLRDSLAGQEEDSIYYEKIKLGKLVEAALQSKRAQLQSTIIEALAPLAIEYRENKLLSEAMVVNAAFLVPAENEPDFDQRLNELANKYDNTLRFKYTAVAPPYNFVNISICL